MADTVRTLSALLTTLFQDGQATGSITPQDIRDLIVSLRATQNDTKLLYTGVNLSGLELAATTLPGTVNVNYVAPFVPEFQYWAGKGASTFRLPFQWERLQTTQNATLNAPYLALIDGAVTNATASGCMTILDCHNFGIGYGADIGSGGTPTASLTNLWSQLGTHYASNPNVIFEIMNEPHNQTAAQWLAISNASIAAIRAAGATTQMIMVDGTAFTGGSTWISSGNSAATGVGLGTVDPNNNYCFDIHQYMDSDFSGTHNTVQSATIGSTSLAAVTAWARTNGKRLFLGEFSAPPYPLGMAALNNQLAFLFDNQDVWLGFSWFVTGPFWSAGSVWQVAEPYYGTDGKSIVADAPQTAVMAKYFSYN